MDGLTDNKTFLELLKKNCKQILKSHCDFHQKTVSVFKIITGIPQGKK